MKINLSLLSTLRTELMGLSAIGIILCHTKGNGVVMPSTIWSVFSLGQIGVPIFFLLSGMGLYYSLTKKNFGMGGVSYWYLTRFIKLFIPYLFFAIPFFLWINITQQGSVFRFLESISTIGFWTSGEASWFVAALVPLYLLIPWWHKWLSGINNRYIPTFVVFFLLICIGGWKHMCEIAFFFLGYWIGKPVKERKSVSVLLCVVTPAIFYVLTSVIPAFGWFPRTVLLVLPVLSVAACLFDKSPLRLKIPFQFMGKISLESYLANTMIPPFIAIMPWVVNGVNLNVGNRLMYLCITVFGITLAYIVHIISKPIVDILILKIEIQEKKVNAQNRLYH